MSSIENSDLSIWLFPEGSNRSSNPWLYVAIIGAFLMAVGFVREDNWIGYMAVGGFMLGGGIAMMNQK